MRATRQGFTRLDLLVSSLLVILTTGMLLPAAQEVKEAEKRKRCVNNLKQLGLAAQNYQSVYERLPPGWLGPFPNESSPKFEKVQNLSVLAYLLPFIERDDVYKEMQRLSTGTYFDLLDLRRTSPAWYLDSRRAESGNLPTVASAKIKDFLCPSAPDMFKASDGVIVAVHFAHDAKGLVMPPFHMLPTKEGAFETLGRTNYFGVSGMYGRGTNSAFEGMRHGLARYEGIFTNRSQNSMKQIISADGTSITLMFGEATGGSHDWQADKPAEKKPMQYAASWMGFGALPTAGGLAQHGERSFWYQFSSAHEGVVNFCFADGAVKALRIGKTATVLYPKPEFPKEPKNPVEDSPYWVLQELAGMRDGGVRPVDSIVP